MKGFKSYKVLSTIAKTWTQPRCPSTDKENTGGCTHVPTHIYFLMDYY